jgi:P4 family phage/plasmid primase-like protien
VPNEKILGILTDERLAISESVFENSRGADEYAARTLRRAHAKIREHAAADFAGEPIDWQAEDGDEMINDARKQAAAAYYETLDKLDPETWGSVELFDHKDDAVQLLHLDEAAFEGLLMRWRERKVPRVTVFEKSVRSSLAKQLRAAAREAKAKARSAASAGVTDSAPKSGEWPHTLNYSSKFGADSVNAKLFLTARPGKLITSSGTLYSLEPACTWAEADEDGLRGEVRETDTEMTLGSSAISAIMRSVRDFTYTPAAPFEWLVSGVDTPDPKNLVLFRNGVLDLRTDELLELDGSYFATGTPAFDFDARAACPAWDDWLHERIDHSFIPTLQEWAGFVMVPDTTAHRFMTFIGKSRTGKGTAKNVLEALVGTAHVGSMAMSDFASNFGLMGALDKRLIVFPDAKDAPSAARGRALERLLAMTGGDRLHIDRKNKAPVDAKLMARLLILGNQHLHWVDESGALAARQIIITFDKTFKGKEDQRVGDSLMAELPGIANWALEGLRRLRANNYQFTIGEAGKAAIKAIRRASSPALRFAEDCLTVTRNPGDFVLLDNVYEAYENWVRQEGLSAGQRRSKTDFADDITATLVGVKITQPRNVPPPPSYTGLREKYRPRVLSGVSAVRYPFV